MDLCHHVCSSIICNTPSYILSCIHALSLCWIFRLSHILPQIPHFCAEEEINLPLDSNFANTKCFEKPFFFLEGAFSSQSLFEKRQTLALLLELWHCGVQKKAAVVPLCFCSGSALWLQSQFLRWKTAATCLMGYVRDFWYLWSIH